jgi:hypothetical protein
MQGGAHQWSPLGGIVDFLRNELPKKVPVDIDETTLSQSHCNSVVICTVSSRLFPALPASQACDYVRCRTGSAAWNGIFILQTADYAHYLPTVRPMRLRDKITSPGADHRWPAMNFGESKGRGFDQVVILPTEPIRRWLSDPATDLKPQSRSPKGEEYESSPGHHRSPRFLILLMFWLRSAREPSCKRNCYRR